MPVAHTPLLERIARVLAGLRLSDNGEGVEASASQSVELEWEDRIEDARAVLRTMREPDAAMAEAGDEAVWEFARGELRLLRSRDNGNVARGQCTIICAASSPAFAEARSPYPSGN